MAADDKATAGDHWRELPSRSPRHDALEELTRAVRELNEATVGTGLDADALAVLAAEVDGVTARLAAVLDEDPWTARSYGPGISESGRVMGINPAIGFCNPTAPVVRLGPSEDGKVAGTVRFGLAHVGPPYRAHGGVIASVFDQVLGVANLSGGIPGMTKSMTVTYRRATPIRVPLRVEAWVTSSEGRASHASGVIYDEDGRPTAEADATFVQPRSPL
jgi:acyl-coenzyme A thioesterase PaaI-like protein